VDAARSQLQTFLDLEARYDDLLRRLDDLDKRVEQVLAENTPAATAEPPGLRITPCDPAVPTS